jgi:GrpB-like predicted nucleotidyltransferase (UPF0157 family)
VVNTKSIGLKRGTVRIVPYNPDWHMNFQTERDLLRNALGSKVLEIRHIGSTAIPGMPAKPIIDIIAAVRILAEVTDFVDPLVRIGYEDRGDGGVVGRRYFVKGTEAARTHHLNFYEMNSSGWSTHILFCEYLKSHKEVAEEYAELKEKLAKEFPTDRASYTSGKERFVAAVVDRATSATNSSRSPRCSHGHEEEAQCKERNSSM